MSREEDATTARVEGHPVIDGRRANVCLAIEGAKPKRSRVGRKFRRRPKRGGGGGGIGIFTSIQMLRNDVIVVVLASLTAPPILMRFPFPCTRLYSRTRLLVAHSLIRHTAEPEKFGAVSFSVNLV